MKLFFAGGFLSSGGERDVWHLRRLYSYHYLLTRALSIQEYKKVIVMRKRFNRAAKPKDQIIDLFLDSGAFSADSKGAVISLEDYAKFIKEYEPYISVYANLDVIGDAEASYQNQKKLESMGLSPMPVFHAGEPIKYLYKYLDEYEYIGLGGTARAGVIARDNFMDKCFNIICDTPDRLPRRKIHGFGLTSIKHMCRYPWYSVDSTSWILTGRMGYIFVPKHKDGKWIYNAASSKIGISNKSPSMKEKGQHITNVTDGVRANIMSYIDEKGYVLGRSEFKMESQDYELKENEVWFEKRPKDKSKKRKVEIIIEPGLSNTNKLRDELNIQFFLDLEKTRPEWPWPFDPESNKFKSLFTKLTNI